MNEIETHQQEPKKIKCRHGIRKDYAGPTLRLSMLSSLIRFAYCLYSCSPFKRSGWFSYVGSPNPSPKSSYNCVDEGSFCTLDTEGVNATVTLAVMASINNFIKGAMVESYGDGDKISYVVA